MLRLSELRVVSKRLKKHSRLNAGYVMMIFLVFEYGYKPNDFWISGSESNIWN